MLEAGMETHDSEKFYLRRRKSLSALMLILFIPLVYLALSHHLYEQVYLALLNLMVVLMGIWLLSTVSISQEGIVLYRFKRLRWEDVCSARRVNFFGLPYIVVKRHKGFPWWLPLYFENHRQIEEALLGAVPHDNPLRSAVRGD
jgi:hypothetical protein